MMRNYLPTIILFLVATLASCYTADDASILYDYQLEECKKEPIPLENVNSGFDIGDSINSSKEPEDWDYDAIFLGNTCFRAFIGSKTYLHEKDKDADYYTIAIEVITKQEGHSNKESLISLVLFERNIDINELDKNILSKQIEEVVLYDEKSNIVSFNLGRLNYKYTLPTINDYSGFSFDAWLSGDEFNNFKLIDKKNINNNYFAVFQDQKVVILASRKVIENNKIGGHRINFEIINKDEIDLVDKNKCIKNEIRYDLIPCESHYCDIETVSYDCGEMFSETMDYKFRWEWITLDKVSNTLELRQYIKKYLDENELKVIMEGKLVF